MENEEFDNVIYEPATLLPKGWIWKKYYDGSGCLISPEKEEFMRYDLSTNEYLFNKNSKEHDLFPLSYYYGDGINPSKFRPFEYMEKEILSKYLHQDIPITNGEIEDRLIPYQKLLDLTDDYFNFDDFGFYLGIINTKKDIPQKEIYKLMNICQKHNTDFINPTYLAEKLTEAVYIKKQLSLSDLDKVPEDDMNTIFFTDKFYLLSDYSSKDNNYEIN